MKEINYVKELTTGEILFTFGIDEADKIYRQLGREWHLVSKSKDGNIYVKDRMYQLF